MENLALFAAALAAFVLAAVGIRVYFLVKRVHRLLDSEVGDMVRAWSDVARGVQEAVGKVDDGLSSLATSLQRVDRLTEKLEPEAMARTVLKPTVAKILSWIRGLRKGLASARGGEKSPTAEDETEAG
jgi:hypothetical protein